MTLINRSVIFVLAMFFVASCSQETQTPASPDDEPQPQAEAQASETTPEEGSQDVATEALETDDPIEDAVDAVETVVDETAATVTDVVEDTQEAAANLVDDAEAEVKAQAQAAKEQAEAEAAAAQERADAAAAAAQEEAEQQAQEAAEAAAAAEQEAAELAAAQAAAAANRLIASGTWTKKSFRIDGSWTLAVEDGVTLVKLDDAFSTKKAPDLKIFLSPLSAAEVGNKNAVNGSVLIAPLNSNKGAQSYIVPDSVDISAYKSIIIHCEAYTKLWGAADL